MTVTKQVEIIIDGRKIRVPQGTTILKAAAMLEIRIPTLCHHEELSPSGSCRLCIVEISNPSQNPDRSWIDSACVCPASEGLNIKTHSPRVLKERKLIIELLLSRAPDSQQIMKLALENGITKPRFTAADEGKSNCILCGLCMRVCNELIKAEAIGFSGRGIKKEVVSPFKIAGDLCIGCKACEAVCPTGVINFKIENKKLRKQDWGVALEMIFCPDCGQPVGTSVQMEQLKEKITITDELLSCCPACRRKKNYSVRTVLHRTAKGLSDVSDYNRLTSKETG
ncbi:MAG: (2Fe-2S)-binding protein [Spirochaetales bacterium]|nr:(2Fe-2S)-binding protein [Spirochaetales bacterium]